MEEETMENLLIHFAKESYLSTVWDNKGRSRVGEGQSNGMAQVQVVRWLGGKKFL